MKVAVTGAAGQLGNVVLRRLSFERSIREIRAIDLRPHSCSSPKITLIKADVRDQNFQRHLEGVDTLIHLAFMVTSYAEPIVYRGVNVEGSRNVFTAAREAGVSQIIYSSSVAAYGILPGLPIPIVEETPRRYQPEFPYAACKYEVEEFLDLFERENPSLLVARLRPVILLGRRMENQLGDGLQKRRIMQLEPAVPLPIVWDEDVAEAILLMIKKRAKGAFNLSADEPMTPAEIAEAMGLQLVRVPDLVAKGAAVVLPFLSRLGLYRSVDGSWIKGRGVPIVSSSEKAKQELGWAPKYKTTKEVIQKFLDEVPSETNPKISAFFRFLSMTARYAPIPEESKRMSINVHLALSGEGGGDYSLRVDRGVLTIKKEVPRPPDAVITIKAKDFVKLLSGELDSSAALITGKIKAEGEPLGEMVIAGLLSSIRTAAKQPGLPGAVASRVSRWLGS